MKAWFVTNHDMNYSTIVFAETRGQAKVIAQSTDACEYEDFIYIRAIRKPNLDRLYRGQSEMDWYNDEDRIAMVKDGMYCSYEVDLLPGECMACPAHKWCERYEDMVEGR